MKKYSRWLTLLLLLIFFAQLSYAAASLSLTVDEGFHLTSGLEYLRTGRLQLFDEHTPLAKALFSWPLLLVPDLPAPESAPGYSDGNLIAVAQATLLAYRPIDRPVVAARLAAALLTLILAALIFRWAADEFGPGGGLLALALTVFDPNLLAHGSLATTDMGATLFIFLALFAFRRYLHRPTFTRWLLAGVTLGLAQAAKLTALLLFPVLGLILLTALLKTNSEKLTTEPESYKKSLLCALCASIVKSLFNPSGSLPFTTSAKKTTSNYTRTPLPVLGAFAGMIAVAALILWASYGFEIRPVAALAGGTLPLPAAAHIERWLRLQDNLAYGRESFLLGQNGMHGWWQYFPLAFAVKTPLPTLLILLALAVALLTRARRALPTELLLGLFPLLYAVASLTSPLNIGYRHLLPIFPFLYTSAGRIATLPFPRLSRTRLIPAALALLILALAVGTLSVAPHYLSYFNHLAGGPTNGWRFLADSNTDWGQNLKALAAYQQHNPGPVKLSLFTFLDPAVYGVDYTPLTPMKDAPPVLPQRFAPAPGRYALSATTLDGVPLALPSTFDWFRHREPQTRLGNALFIYDVPAVAPPAWIAQCTQPAVPLDETTLQEGFGTLPARRLTFDCEHAWILPAGGLTSGRYARTAYGIDGLSWPTAGNHPEWWPAWIPASALAQLQLSYVQPTPGGLPPFALWERPAGAPALPDTPPVHFADVLTFLGLTHPPTARPGETIDIVTWWQVQTPPTRTLSLMLHLVAPDGSTVAVGDGLNFPLEQWQGNDIIAQRHTLQLPETIKPGTYTLVSGVYWLDTVEPLPIDAESSALQRTLKVIP